MGVLVTFFSSAIFRPSRSASSGQLQTNPLRSQREKHHTGMCMYVHVHMQLYVVVCYSKCSTPQYYPYCVVYQDLSLLQVFDLGRDGCGLSHVTSISMDTIVQKATVALRLVWFHQSLGRDFSLPIILPPFFSLTLSFLSPSLSLSFPSMLPFFFPLSPPSLPPSLPPFLPGLLTSLWCSHYFAQPFSLLQSPPLSTSLPSHRLVMMTSLCARQIDRFM